LTVAPADDQVAVANHRHELLIVDLQSEPPTAKLLDRSSHGGIAGVGWSGDGRWLAYGFPQSAQSCAIKVARVETGETTLATRPILADTMPSFDPDGKYLYFIGQREFDPVYDALHFDLGFPKGAR